MRHVGAQNPPKNRFRNRRFWCFFCVFAARFLSPESGPQNWTALTEFQLGRARIPGSKNDPEMRSPNRTFSSPKSVPKLRSRGPQKLSHADSFPWAGRARFWAQNPARICVLRNAPFWSKKLVQNVGPWGGSARFPLPGNRGASDGFGPGKICWRSHVNALAGAV